MFLAHGQDWNPNTSWVPPPFERLNWSDCSAIGNYTAAAALEQRFDHIPVNTTVTFARSLVPTDWPDSPPTQATLLIWAWSWLNETSPDNAITGQAWNVTYTGTRQVCDKLEVEGDPDLAGIGMMFTYYLIAMMSTMYPLILGLDALELFSKSSRLARIVDWFRETISGFLDASLIFAMAILIAAMYRFISAFRDPDQLDNAFAPSRWNAIIVALFSVFPPLILQCTSGDMLRRKGLRLLLWSLVVVFTATSSVLFFVWYKSLNLYVIPLTKTGSIQYLWNICTQKLPRRFQQNLGFVIAAQAQLLFNLALWAYSMSSKLGLAQHGRVSRKVWSMLQKGQTRREGRHRSSQWTLVCQLRVLQILSAQLMMWLLLGLLTSLILSDGVIAGDSFKNLRWSVGQVLGLAQFAPVVIDLAVAGIYGPKAAWEERMSRRFVVVDATTSDNSTGEGDATQRLTKATTM